MLDQFFTKVNALLHVVYSA